MIRKEFLLEETDIAFLQMLAESKGFTSLGQTFRYVLREYQRILQGMDPNTEKVMKQLDIILAIIREQEQDGKELKDAANTFLLGTKMEKCIPIGVLESPVFTKSRQYKKEKLAQLKQRKDNKARKE